MNRLRSKATLSQPLGCAQVILVKYPPEERKLRRYHLRAIYVLFIRAWAVKFTPPEQTIPYLTHASSPT